MIIILSNYQQCPLPLMRFKYQAYRFCYHPLLLLFQESESQIENLLHGIYKADTLTRMVDDGGCEVFFGWGGPFFLHNEIATVGFVFVFLLKKHRPKESLLGWQYCYVGLQKKNLRARGRRGGYFSKLSSGKHHKKILVYFHLLLTL